MDTEWPEAETEEQANVSLPLYPLTSKRSDSN